jgi:hypothetical protein
MPGVPQVGVDALTGHEFVVCAYLIVGAALYGERAVSLGAVVSCLLYLRQLSGPLDMTVRLSLVARGGLTVLRPTR